MKSIVIYYSYSGNTKKVAGALAEALKARGEVEELELQALDESKSFFGQCGRAFQHKRAQIADVKTDLSGYGLICFGTPIWAFAPTPAMNTYLDKCGGINGKDVILFCTYGSGTGKEKCLDYMQKILADKGARGFKRFSIQQGRAASYRFPAEL
jgi:flavodoxin